MSQPIGAHVSISGALELAFARGEEIGCTAIQIFTKNASQWRAKPIDAESAAAFKKAWEASPIGPVIVHDTYLINLAAPDEEKWAKSKATFADELVRCDLLGIPQLVMHPGNHMGEGEDAGIARIAAAFRELFDAAPASMEVLLENTAGQGSAIGWRFEHLAEIMAQVPQGRFGLCFDTCHAFAAGYDLSSGEGYIRVMEELERLVGIDRVRAFHVNDSKKGLDSRVDRHEQLGEGAIGIEGFRALMQDARFAGVPKILETPKGVDNEWDLRNLALLRKLAGES